MILTSLRSYNTACQNVKNVPLKELLKSASLISRITNTLFNAIFNCYSIVIINIIIILLHFDINLTASITA